MFTEIMSDAQKMAKGEKTGFLTLNFDWLYWPLFKMNGIELLTPDMKKAAFNTPKTVSVLERLAKATNSGAINKISWTGRWVEPNGAFAGNTVGMLHAHSSSYFFVKGQGSWINPSTLGVAQAPEYWATPTNHGFGISKTTKNPDLAWAFIKHLTSTQWATRFSQSRKLLTGNIAADPPDPTGNHFAVVWFDDRNAPHPVNPDPYQAVTNADNFEYYAGG